MSFDFVAIDVETANANMASICQVGLAGYANRQLVVQLKSYVDPQDYFDPINVSIHGIDESAVADAPTLDVLASEIYRLLDGQISVCHTHFDRVAVHQAFGKCGLRAPACKWLDSARVARRAWKQFASAGYGLANVCKTLGYVYRAHDALEDAKAAAHVLDAAIQTTGLTVQDWLDRVRQPIDPATTGSTIASPSNRPATTATR